MSKEELVESYLRGEISRRIFIRRLLAAGISLSAALAYAEMGFGSSLRDAPGAAADFYGPGAPATLTLSPATDTNTAGEQHCVTATVKDAAGRPTPGIAVRFSISGSNSASGSVSTDASGMAVFCYTGTVAGLDTITAFADTNNDGSQSLGEPSGSAQKTYVPGTPATLALTPATDTNPVDTQHCVTATVKDTFGNPVPDVTVRFSVTGAPAGNSANGSEKTNSSGEASFCYAGPSLGPSADTIKAFADTSGDGTQNGGEPGSTAQKSWTPGSSTSGCTVTLGGRIKSQNGDKATFGGNAKVSNAGVASGKLEYQDHGPAQRLNVKAKKISTVICSADRKQATITGEATVNGSGSFLFRVDVKDLGEPGRSDTFRIRLSNGYDSGEKTLESGNVQIHK